MGNHILPGFTVEDVLYSENAQYTPCFKLVKYNLINGSHVPHFSPILKSLKKIHDLGMVHGDIRLCNLVFGEAESDSYIIDFDIASKEGTLYCVNYNRSVPERHPSIKCTDTPKLSKAHDRYSIATIIEQQDNNNSYGDIITAIKDSDERLDCIANRIVKL